MKNFILRVIQCFIKLIYIIPLRKNLIVFTAYHGEGYSCSPKYLSEYLYQKNKYQIVWAFKSPDKFKKMLPQNVKIVKYKSIFYIFYEMIAKVRVNNAEEWIILPRRKGQLVLNTWHGGGVYKKVGFDASLVKNEYLSNDDYYNISNVFLSSCGAASQYMFRRSFKYKGNILKSGLPRNDIFFANVDVEKMKEKIGIEKEIKTVLYAPTVRETNNSSFEMIDFDRLVENLHEKFGGTWKILLKAHLGTIAGAGGGVKKMFSNEALCINVTEYPDMQELLVAADILITDYSSSIWDYSFTYKPCFLYVPDLEVYKSDERGFYFDISEWGFPYAQSNDELESCIENYNEQKYKKSVKKHHESLESYEKGEASRIVGEYIEDWCFSK